MKIKCESFWGKSAHRLGVPKPGEDGSATVVFVALLAIMLILVTAEGRALFQLRREVKLLEQRQIKQLNNWQTNTVPVTKLDSK